MLIQVKRIRQAKNSTLSEIYIDDQFFCYGLEDSVHRSGNKKGCPSIPQGTYRLGLRKYGAMHARYSRRFREMHQGVLHILGVPAQHYAYIHVGKDFCDTSGGLLVGMAYEKDDLGDYGLKKSTKAYKRLYSSIVERIEKEEVKLVISEYHVV